MSKRPLKMSALSYSHRHEHGTYLKYLGGCRCDACKSAICVYRRRLRKRGGNPYVSSRCAQHHVRDLRTHNISFERIAGTAHVSVALLYDLSISKHDHIRAENERRILKVTPQNIKPRSAYLQRKRKPLKFGEVVPIVTVRSHLRKLRRKGLSLAMIARRSGVSEPTVSRISISSHSQLWVRKHIADAILGVTEAMRLTKVGGRINSIVARQMLTKLIEEGFWKKTIASMAGLSTTTLRKIMTIETTSLRTHRKLVELFEKISDDALLIVPPERIKRRGMVNTDSVRELIGELVEEGFTKTKLAQMAGLALSSIKRIFRNGSIRPSTHRKIIELCQRVNRGRTTEQKFEIGAYQQDQDSLSN